ncbi:adenylate/guanylate cyclase domain-containing protein [Leptospira sp. 96542]|nr:adenylate/guanylate cyclase domain-containing protein [Leptospira sp. 96542]
MHTVTFLEANKHILNTKNPGETILETAMENQFPLYHLCGGNARCTTCRVFVVDGLKNLSERNEREQNVATRKGWKDQIRLACQTEIYGNIEIQRIIQDDLDLKTVRSEGKNSKTGEERYAVILFLDIKGFTSFTEASLAYDVVFVLNRFFQEMSEPIINNGGYIDKFIGDGILAYFFLDADSIQYPSNTDTLKKEIYIQSIRACMRILDKLNSFNEYMKERFHHTFDIRIGLHAGTVIYGDIGHSDHRSLTVLGDTVNVASRLEALNKKTNTRLLISDEIYNSISGEISVNKKIITRLRGKSEKMTAYSVINFRKRDKILEVQRSLDLAILRNPNFSKDMYSIIEVARPDLFSYFKESNMKSLEEKFIQKISQVIEKVGDKKNTNNELTELGKFHASIGIPKAEFKAIIPVILNVLEQSLNQNWTNELREDWEELLNRITDQMTNI